MYNMDPYDNHSKPTKAQVDEIVEQTIKHFGKELDETPEEKQINADLNNIKAKLHIHKEQINETIKSLEAMSDEGFEENRDRLIKLYSHLQDEISQAEEIVYQEQREMLFYRSIIADPNLSYTEKRNIINNIKLFINPSKLTKE